MNDIGDEDRDLRERFAELREDVSVGAPSFRALAEGSPPRRIRTWVPVTAGLAAAAALLVITLLPSHDTLPELDPAFATAIWTGPTDYLLLTPDRGVLGSIPEIGFGLALPTSADPDRRSDDTVR